ncbi:MAG: hypothetical protein RMJ36_00030 [Candidatus Calescibacterium sp.]|nr:hypothetical protein [Candidatus Calescibacterium sp.]MDW8132033.1 hypothetical protein [Candidatus Calescibacterium sp.]
MKNLLLIPLLLIINLNILQKIETKDNIINPNANNLIVFLGGGNANFNQFEILSILLIDKTNGILKKNFPGVLNESQYIKEFTEIIDNTPQKYKLIIIGHSAGANISLIDSKNTKILIGMNFEYLPEKSIVINGIFDEFHPPWETIKITKHNYYLIFSNHISELTNPKTAEIILKHINPKEKNKNSKNVIAIIYIINQLIIIYTIINIGYNFIKPKINPSNTDKPTTAVLTILIITLLITIIHNKETFLIFYSSKIIMIFSLIIFGILLRLTNFINNNKIWLLLLIFFTTRLIVNIFYSIPFFINIKQFQNISIDIKGIFNDIFSNIFGNIYFLMLNIFNDHITLLFIVFLLVLVKYKKEIIESRIKKYLLIITENKKILIGFTLFLFTIGFTLNFLSYYLEAFVITDISRMIQFIGKELMIILLTVHFYKISLLKLNHKINNS